MKAVESITSRLFKPLSATEFESLALDVFQFQYENVPVYRSFCENLKIGKDNITSLNKIPFLPIELFKSNTIIARDKNPEIAFRSSGTTGIRSKHFVANIDFYKQSLLFNFERVFPEFRNYRYFSILPGYEENPHSSLIFMVNEIVSKSSLPVSTFKSHHELIGNLIESNEKGERSFLFGVAFELMDIAERYDVELLRTIILETGGMKGKRREITRSELHDTIIQKLKPEKLVSEYGMTELFSQAYAIQSHQYQCPPQMKILIRNIQDPIDISYIGKGAINVIDLCNVFSCSFIATDDLGDLKSDGTFEVLGRLDHSDIRGCNLLYAPDQFPNE